jgi:HEAT repeat protein
MGSGGVEALADAAKQQTGQAHDVATAMLTNRFIALQIGASGIFIKTHDKSADVRRQAIEALGYIGADRNLAMIAAMEALTDPVAEVRLTAVTALARTGLSNSDVVDTFTRYLKDENPSVRELAVSSLGKMGPVAESAIPELKRIMESGTAAERNAARQAIEKIRASK